MLGALKGRGQLTKNVHFYFNTNNSNKSFYRRLLPQQLIALNSHQGKKIFEESLMEKNSEAFFTLVQQFITQSSPSTCASATMAMILNSLQIDPKVNWKGIWRWYDDFNIQQMQQRHLSDGLTLEEYDQLIRLNQTKSMAFSPLLNLELAQSTTLKQSSATLFRSCISACTRRSNLLLTLNFHRKSLGQTGDGHFSPVAAYNSKRDLALILDVAKFKYDSYWCPVEQLYEALKPFDKVSNQSRGFLINKKRYEYEEQPESPLCYLQLDFELNRKFKSREYFHSPDLRTFLVELLNDIELHALLIPLFYEFSTFEHQDKQAILQAMLKQSVIEQLSADFNNGVFKRQAVTLLSAFSKDNKLTPLFFLSLVFECKKGSEAISPNLPNQAELQLFKLIQKCQIYLQLDSSSPGGWG